MPVHGKGRFQPASGEHSYRPSSRSSLAYIAEYRALKRPGSAEALRMLRRVGSLVKPLMSECCEVVILFEHLANFRSSAALIDLSGGSRQSKMAGDCPCSQSFSPIRRIC